MKRTKLSLILALVLFSSLSMAAVVDDGSGGGGETDYCWTDSSEDGFDNLQSQIGNFEGADDIDSVCQELIGSDAYASEFCAVEGSSECVYSTSGNSRTIDASFTSNIIYVFYEKWGSASDNIPFSLEDARSINSNLIYCRSKGYSTVKGCAEEYELDQKRYSRFVAAMDGVIRGLRESQDNQEESNDGGSEDKSDSDVETLPAVDSYEGDGWSFVYVPPKGIDKDRLDVRNPVYSIDSEPDSVKLNIDGKDSICGVARWEKTFNVGSIKEVHFKMDVKDERKYLDGNPVVGQGPQTVFIEINDERVYEKDFEPGGSDEYMYLMDTIQSHDVVVGVEGPDYDKSPIGCDQYYRRTDLDIQVAQGSSPFEDIETEDGSEDDSDSSDDSSTEEDTTQESGSTNWDEWTLHKSTIEEHSDDQLVIGDVRDGKAILDSGAGGYCGEAYFSKSFSVSGDTADKLEFDYTIDADEWAGRAFVSVDGEDIEYIDPNGNDNEGGIEKSGTWEVYLGEGAHEVRFGIRDENPDTCHNGDHALRLEMNDVARTDSSFGS